MITICRIWYRIRLEPHWTILTLKQQMHGLSKFTLIQMVSFWFPDPSLCISLPFFATYVPKESKRGIPWGYPRLALWSRLESCRFVSRKEVEKMTWQWLCWIFNERHLLWSSLCRLLTSLLLCLLLGKQGKNPSFRRKMEPWWNFLRSCRLCNGSKHRKE